MRFVRGFFGKINFRRAIVALCFFGVCVGTQKMQTVKWDAVSMDLSRDMLGIYMALILFTHYKREDFLRYKKPYIIWSILGGILLAVGTPIVAAGRESYLAADTAAVALGIFLMGYCLIHTAISFFVEKYRPVFYLPLFGIWMVMMLLMIFSRSDYLWPECYFVLFLCYYMTKQTEEQRSNVIWGMVDGIILAFIAIQAHALLCRPYDRVRYYGNFCNPNQNATFLCISLAAILARLLYVAKENKKRILSVFFFLLAGVDYSFICMTASRSGYLTVFVVTIFFLAAYCKIKGKKIFIKTGMLLVGIFIILFPLTYLAVRYVPTIHPHVVFYFQEGYSEDRVHSWDGRDSEKYITFGDLMQNIFWRFEAAQRSYHNMFGSESGEEQETGGLEIVSVSNEVPIVAQENPPAETDHAEHESMTAAEEAINPNKIPLLTKESSVNDFEVRYTIYKWYFDHLSLRGMPYDDQGFQLTEDHWIQDTHDIYLDYGINFGWPVMILFTVFIWWGIGRLAGRGMKSRDLESLFCLFILLVPPIFGLFEFAWGAGMTSTVAFYLSFREILEGTPLQNS